MVFLAINSDLQIIKHILYFNCLRKLRHLQVPVRECLTLASGTPETIFISVTYKTNNVKMRKCYALPYDKISRINQ